MNHWTFSAVAYFYLDFGCELGIFYLTELLLFLDIE